MPNLRYLSLLLRSFGRRVPRAMRLLIRPIYVLRTSLCGESVVRESLRDAMSFFTSLIVRRFPPEHGLPVFATGIPILAIELYFNCVNVTDGLHGLISEQDIPTFSSVFRHRRPECT